MKSAVTGHCTTIEWTSSFNYMVPALSPWSMDIRPGKRFPGFHDVINFCYPLRQPMAVLESPHCYPIDYSLVSIHTHRSSCHVYLVYVSRPFAISVMSLSAVFTCRWTYPIVWNRFDLFVCTSSMFRDGSSDDADDLNYRACGVVITFRQQVMLSSMDFTPTRIGCFIMALSLTFRVPVR